MPGNFLAEISNPKDAVKTVGIPRVERAQDSRAIGKVSESAGETAALGREVVQELRCSFILPHANMAIVRSDRHNAIIAHLMYVLRRSEYARIHFSHSLGVFQLIAGVMKRRQPELIVSPFAEIARAVSLLLIGSRS